LYLIVFLKVFMLIHFLLWHFCKDVINSSARQPSMCPFLVKTNNIFYNVLPVSQDVAWKSHQEREYLGQDFFGFQENIRKKKELQSDIFNKAQRSGAALLVHGPNGKVVLSNPPLRKLFGVPTSEDLMEANVALLRK